MVHIPTSPWLLAGGICSVPLALQSLMEHPRMNSGETNLPCPPVPGLHLQVQLL